MRKKAQQPATYPVANVKVVNLCSDLYKQWSSTKKLYEKAPPDGLTMDVEYADTELEAQSSAQNSNMPLVLALHGAPGSHRDFAKLIQYFSQRQVRVIAPNFPDYKATIRTQVFRHSAEEKAEFVKRFLETIKVEKVDLLVSHSSAIYPTLLLWKDTSAPCIKSIAFLNPAGHRRIKAMRPMWMTDGSVRVYQNKFGRFVFKVFGTTFLAIVGAPVRVDNMNSIMLSLTTMVYSKYKTFEAHLRDVRESGMPVLFVYSENDKLIEKEIFFEMAAKLGATDDNSAIYDPNGVVLKSVPVEEKLRVLCFQSGGHYAYCKYSDTVHEAIHQQLEKVTTKTQLMDRVEQ